MERRAPKNLKEVVTMYTVYLACSRCSWRRVLLILSRKDTARQEFNQFARQPRPRCPECEDVGVDLELRDPFNIVIGQG
jgi:hypothetical protein